MKEIGTDCFALFTQTITESVTEVFVEEPLALPGSAKNLRILSAQSSSKILIVARSVICLVGPPT